MAVGRDNRGPITITVVQGKFDRLRDVIFDPAPLEDAVGLDRSTGREWLIDAIDEYIAGHPKGCDLLLLEHRSGGPAAAFMALVGSVDR